MSLSQQIDIIIGQHMYYIGPQEEKWPMWYITPKRLNQIYKSRLIGEDPTTKASKECSSKICNDIRYWPT